MNIYYSQGRNIKMTFEKLGGKFIFTVALLFLFGVYSPAPTFAQTDTIEKSEAHLATQTKDTPAYAKALLGVAQAYFGYDPSISVAKAEQVIVLAKKHGLVGLQSRAHWLVGFGHIRLGQIGPDLIHVVKSLSLAKQVGDHKLEVDALRLMGVHYDYQKDLPKALDYMIKSYEKAMEHGYVGSAAIAKNNLGYVLIKEGRPEEALEHLQMGVALAEEAKEMRNLGLSLSNLGIALSQTGQVEKGILALERALAIGDEIQNMAIIGYGSQGLGAAYAMSGREDDAERIYLLAMNDERLYKYPEYMLKTYLGLGGLYTSQGKYDQAEGIYLAGLEVMKGQSVFEPQLRLYTILSKLAADKGNYLEAFKYERSQREIRDEMQPISDLSVVDTLQSILKFREQEKALLESHHEQSLQTAKLERQQTVVYFSLIALLFALASLYFYYRSRQRKFALISERNLRLQMKQEDLKEEANQLQQMVDAKSKIFTNTSHDLRSPLSNIVGFSKLLQSERLTSQQAELVGYIQESAEMQSQLLNDVLDLAQFEQGIFKIDYHTDTFARAFKVSVSGWRLRAKERSLELTVDFHETKGQEVEAPFKRIIQVAGNLVVNAINYTKNGSIHLSVKIIDDGWVKLTAADTGGGIAPEKLEGLFTRFSQERPASKSGQYGAGLGLSICTELVNHWGGEIGAESTIGEGSSFWFTVPIKVVDPDDSFDSI